MTESVGEPNHAMIPGLLERKDWRGSKEILAFVGDGFGEKHQAKMSCLSQANILSLAVSRLSLRSNSIHASAR